MNTRMVSTPLFLDLCFVVFVFGFYFILIRSLHLSKFHPRIVLTLGGGLALWLGVTGSLAAIHMLEDFSGAPPRVILVALPALLAAVVFGTSSFGQSLLKKVSLQQITYFQTFRAGVEAFLWILFSYGAMPLAMTFEGGNYDIAVGLTAPLIGAFCFHGKKVDYRLVLVWNLAGFLFLTNAVGHAILSAPTSFQRFHTFPSTALIGTFPYFWLPCFLVPVAYFLHFVSIKACIQEMRPKNGKKRAN